ncbi:branched-chain amino acid aminotransferase [Oceanicella actignis]|nr:branched-chain amino acid aminotransferase [Oceanicella actignis]
MAGGETWTWFDGAWTRGAPMVASAADHGLWLGSCVFDGARAFEGVAPDLELHCARLNASARAMGLNPPLSDERIAQLCREGLSRFSPGAAVYIRPMCWARDGGAALIAPDPDSAAFCLCLEELPMAPFKGFSITLTRYRRPLPSMATTDAKAACLYPNNARMVREARARGFDNALALDALDNVAELATSNVFIVRDGVAMTPIPNGTFLNGITRQRVIGLLRDDGIEVRETVLTVEDVRAADEVFSTGNAHKVMPVTRFDDREYPVGPVTRRARELYWDFAHGRL